MSEKIENLPEEKKNYKVEWNKNHKEEVKAYNKKYYNEHRIEAIKKSCEIITCNNCGREFVRNWLKGHQKTKYCLRVANKKNNEI